MVEHRLGTGESLSADLIAQRSFTTNRKGFDPGEVKTFLAAVATTVRDLREQLRTSEAARKSAEERALHPKIDEEMLLSAVGEETATILRTARVAATDIRTKAEDQASALLRDTQAQAEAVTAEAEAQAARVVAEVAESVEAIRARAEDDAERIRSAARHEAEAVRRLADQERKMTVEGAQQIREQILSDLTRRRRVANTQIEQLRAGRERLLEAYVVVRRTLDEVTDQLQRADGEARQAADDVARRAADRPNDDLLLDWSAGASPSGSGGQTPGPDRPTEAMPVLDLDEPASAPESVAAGPAGGDDQITDELMVQLDEPSVPPKEQTEQLDEPVRWLGQPSAQLDEPAPSEEAAPLDEVAPLDEPTAQFEVINLAPEPPVPDPEDSPRSGGTGVSVEGDGEGADARSSSLAGPSAGSPHPAQASLHRGVQVMDATDEVDQVRLVDAGGVAEADDAGAGVDSIFARIRADRADALVKARAVLQDDGDDRADDQPGDDQALVVDQAAVSDEQPVPDGDEGYLLRRDDATTDVEVALARRLKRALQDEQNDLLDRLRQVRGAPKAANLLAKATEQRSRYTAAARPQLAAAAEAGMVFAAGFGSRSGFGTPSDETRPPPHVDDLAVGLATAITDPLRRRLQQAFAESAGDDQSVLIEALGAVYRECKSQRVEQLAGDHVTAAFSRGAFEGTPEGTRLRWLVDDLGGPCPDCDDNVLAGGLSKGDEYPTGQVHPPAHSGCRCLLVPLED